MVLALFSILNPVLVVSHLNNGNLGFCSGVLIEKSALITAAHCLENAVSSSIQYQADGPVIDEINNRRIAFHPGYHPQFSLFRDDIAVVKLGPANPIASPLTLPLCRADHIGELVTRVGFGGRNGLNQEVQFQVQVIAHDHRDASIILDDPYSMPGDSGGPIFALESGQTCILGIHSTLESHPDGSKISFNTSPYLLRSWIRMILSRP